MTDRVQRPLPARGAPEPGRRPARARVLRARSRRASCKPLGRRRLRPRHHAGPHAVLRRRRGAGRARTARAAGTMRVRSLTLVGFRSYQRSRSTSPPGPQVVVGANAAGKTNLSRRSSCCRAGRSHRTSADAELIALGRRLRAARGRRRAGRPGHDRASRSSLGARRAAPAPASGSASTACRAGQRALAAALPRRCSSRPRTCCSSSARRRWPARVARRARRAARARRGRDDGDLRAGARRSATTCCGGSARARPSRDELRVLGRRRRRREGGRIVDWRRETPARLWPGRSPRPTPRSRPRRRALSLRYVTNAPPGRGETPTDALRRRLAETAEKEVWNGATLVGPHRDDVAFELDGRDLTGFASRGQQRTAILALKLAELDLLAELDGRPPLLLLDDVFSELDPDRRAHLVRRIGELPQAFVTTTDARRPRPGARRGVDGVAGRRRAGWSRRWAPDDAMTAAAGRCAASATCCRGRRRAGHRGRAAGARRHGGLGADRRGARAGRRGRLAAARGPAAGARRQRGRRRSSRQELRLRADGAARRVRRGARRRATARAAGRRPARPPGDGLARTVRPTV